MVAEALELLVLVVVMEVGPEVRTRRILVFVIAVISSHSHSTVVAPKYIEVSVDHSFVHRKTLKSQEEV